MSIAFSPDSKWLAFVAYMDGVRFWDVNSHSEMTNLPAYFQQDSALGFAFSPDSRILAYNEDEYGVIVLWDLVSDSVFGRLRRHESYVSALAFSPDGRTLASGSQDRTVKLWNVTEQRERISFSKHTSTVVSLAFSPDGHTLATAGDSPPIRLVDVQTGAQKAELRGHRLSITSLVFTADGRTLLSAIRWHHPCLGSPTGTPEEKLGQRSRRIWFAAV